MAKAQPSTITLELSWAEARALAALVGKVNGRNLDSVWDALTPHVGEHASDDFEITQGGRDGADGSRVTVLTVRNIETGEW